MVLQVSLLLVFPFDSRCQSSLPNWNSFGQALNRLRHLFPSGCGCVCCVDAQETDAIGSYVSMSWLVLVYHNFMLLFELQGVTSPGHKCEQAPFIG